jgi:hypothetical protein
LVRDDLLDGLQIALLGDAAALVLGEWKLDGLGEPVGATSRCCCARSMGDG